ncbi:MAG: hypothetical protein V1894_04010 [Chloroflexota bacterium]
MDEEFYKKVALWSGIAAILLLCACVLVGFPQLVDSKLYEGIGLYKYRNPDGTYSVRESLDELGRAALFDLLWMAGSICVAALCFWWNEREESDIAKVLAGIGVVTLLVSAFEFLLHFGGFIGLH